MPAPLSLDLRRRILAAVLAGGATQRQVADRFAVGLATVEDLLRRYRDTGSVEPKAYRRGPARLLSDADDVQVERYLDPEHGGDVGLTLGQLVDRFEADTGRRVSEMTLSRALVRREVTRKKRRSTPPSA